MPYLVNIQKAFPKNFYSQDQIIEGMKSIWEDKFKNTKRLEDIHQNVLVASRHLAMPLEDYFKEMSFGERNKYFIETSVDLAEESVSKLLQENHLSPKDISSLWSNTVTGLAIPSIEARLMNRIDFPKNTKRLPLLGLGCMAGVAGINRVSDYLKGHPTEAVIFFSVELCSLTLQVQDISVANIVSTGLFGDGAAAVLMVGDEHPLAANAPLKWIGSESIFFDDSEDVMGWDISETGFKIILSKSVPKVTENELPGPLSKFLTSYKLQLSDISTFLAHPGGPKVMEAMEKVLDLPQKGLKHSWQSLSENGNMSSVSVLDIMERTIQEKKSERKNTKGEFALALAMGPAFSSELGLWQWN